MTVRITRILSGAEFNARNDAAMARGLWNTDRHEFPPGTAWYQPWYVDPLGEDGDPMLTSPPDDSDRSLFSPHYWRSWADRRPPICVVCPNGELWEIDRRSSNGTGWVVTGDLSGDAPSLTCSPSIVVHGYHGFLRDGLFTADVEGRPPNGIERPYMRRT